MVEGRLTGKVDTRLEYYTRNQEQVPLVCNRVIPERLGCLADHAIIQARLFGELKALGGDILCKEWVDSRGVIVRPSRACLEVKAPDEQECIFSDIAFTAFIRALIDAKGLELEEDRDALLELMGKAIDDGTRDLRPELLGLCRVFEKHAKVADHRYLRFVRQRIEEGSLGELLRDRMQKDKNTIQILIELERCLMDNTPYTGPR
jgi:hypothetical protein